MKKLYFYVILACIVSLALFVFSFVYLDRARHRIYHYNVYQAGKLVGTIQTDRFATEDRIVYRELASTPFDPLFTESTAKITLDKRYRLENYSRERSFDGGTELTLIENRQGLISFLTRFQSRFACLSNMPMRKDTFVFKEDMPVTYLPIIENYNFSRGKTQGFSALTPFEPFLPPAKRIVTLTSIKNEYLKIDNRKIGAENLLLKIRKYPQGSIWISRSDQSLLVIEIPERALKIVRTFTPRQIEATEYAIRPIGYRSSDVSFKNGATELAATITVPDGRGPHPGILLIGGTDPYNRDNAGLFTDIADYLARNGYAVLRFDRRGIGQSAGSATHPLDTETLADSIAALTFLAAQPEIDPHKMGIIGHEKGAYFAAAMAGAHSDLIRALVLMAMPTHFGPPYGVAMATLEEAGKRYRWAESFAQAVAQSIKETTERAQNARFNWVLVLGRRCLTANMKEELAYRPIDAVKALRVPILVLQGKNDTRVNSADATAIDTALTENGTGDHTLILYGYLGHFFGKLVTNGVYRFHYETDTEVLENIKSWLDKNLKAARITAPVAHTPAETPTTGGRAEN